MEGKELKAVLTLTDEGELIVSENETVTSEPLLTPAPDLTELLRTEEPTTTPAP